MIPAGRPWRASAAHHDQGSGRHPSSATGVCAHSLPDLTIHGLRHSALMLAGQHGATVVELQPRAGHTSRAAMAIYQHGTADRDRLLAERLGETVAESKAWSALLSDA